jgi:hypothetical protein
MSRGYDFIHLYGNIVILNRVKDTGVGNARAAAEILQSQPIPSALLQNDTKKETR